MIITSKKTFTQYQNSGLVSVSLIVDRMGKIGFIKKVRNVSDRRVVSINITPRGKKLLEEASSPTIDLIKKLFSVYYDAELIQMTSLVDKLSGTVEEGSPGDKVNKLILKQRINILYIN